MNVLISRADENILYINIFINNCV